MRALALHPAGLLLPPRLLTALSAVALFALTGLPAGLGSSEEGGGGGAGAGCGAGAAAAGGGGLIGLKALSTLGDDAARTAGLVGRHADDLALGGGAAVHLSDDLGRAGALGGELTGAEAISGGIADDMARLGDDVGRIGDDVVGARFTTADDLRASLLDEGGGVVKDVAEHSLDILELGGQAMDIVAGEGDSDDDGTVAVPGGLTGVKSIGWDGDSLLVGVSSLGLRTLVVTPLDAEGKPRGEVLSQQVQGHEIKRVELPRGTDHALVMLISDHGERGIKALGTPVHISR